MNTGKSSLNANAAVYIPLSKRGEHLEHPLAAPGSESSNVAAGFGYHPGDATVNYHLNKASPIYQNQFAPTNYHNYKNPTSEAYTWRRSDYHGSYASSSKSPKAVSQKDFLDEESDMDLAYLQMTFPDFSDESLSHIYLANGGDLEITVEMLKQLELCEGDAPELLPDTLEIGNTSESQSLKEDTSLKMKEVANEIAGSSGSSNQHSVQN